MILILAEDFNNEKLYEEYSGSSMRSSNLELLRIVCMIMIIMHHFAYHGGFPIL